jgi:hypothetical protein
MLMVLAVLSLGGLFAVACEEDDDGDSSPTATESDRETPSGGETPSDGETPDDGAEPTEADDGDGASGSLDDIPVPEGATEDGSGTYTADQIPFVDPGGTIDPGALANIQWRTYDVSQNSDAVLDFYQNELTDWDEIYVLSTGPAKFGIWSRSDNDEVLWVGTTDVGQGTELILIHGSAS